MNAAFNSKLKILIISTFFVLSSCAVKQTEFVDKRFNIPLKALSSTVRDTQLKPNEILSYSDKGELIERYYNCKLLENKMRFIKYECQNIQFFPVAIETVKRKKQIGFEIPKEKDDFWKDAYIVKGFDFLDYTCCTSVKDMIEHKLWDAYFLYYN